MILWFAGTALAAMWIVFRDPAVDHRLVVAGALAPDLLDSITGGAWIGHTLAFAVGSLFVVMGLTVGHRRVRRRLLALPIGWFFHLVFDGVWTERSLFWWPVDGWSFQGIEIPVVSRSMGQNVVLEIVGLMALIWAFNRFGLGDAARRREFIRSGRVDRALTDPTTSPPTC